jgi:hypothetical protein
MSYGSLLSQAIVACFEFLCKARADDVCSGWLLSPTAQGRIDSSINSSTRETGQQPTDLTHVF